MMLDVDETHNEMLALHRDGQDDPVLVGPDCEKCLTEETLTYVCNRCDMRWRVAGVWRWSWRRESHFHDPHLGMAWHYTSAQHVSEHARNGKPGAVVMTLPPGWSIERGTT